MPQMNPKTTAIAVPAKGAANFALIAMTIMAGTVEIIEDPSVNAGVAQGLTGFYMDPDSKGNPQVDPNLPTSQVWLPNSAGQTGRAYQPIRFGGEYGRVHGAFGNTVGADGTPLLKLQSNSATPTQVLLVEWP